MISIVIPVFNEEENVIPLFQSIKEVMSELGEEYEVIFIDDGSKDNTLANLKSLLENGEGKGIIRIIELRRNFGQTPALLAGFARVKGDLVVTMDGDMQNDPKDIPKMLEALDDSVDVICGWRKNRKDNFLKRIPSKISNFLNRRLNKLKIHDSGCTFRLYRREATQNLPLFAEGHRYIPAILSQRGFRLGEVETTHHPRTKGKTKYGFRRLFRGLIDLITLRILFRWGVKPGHFFSLLGALFVGASLIIGIWLLLEKYVFWLFWDKYTWNYSIGQRPLLILCLLLFVSGVQFLLNGFIAELIARGTQDPEESYRIRKEWN